MPHLASAASQKCCTMYKALHDEALAVHGHDLFWRQKPKMHLFQELAEYQQLTLGNPRLFWAYMDEDFVGWVATRAKSWGGVRHGATTPKNVLQQYRALAD